MILSRDQDLSSIQGLSVYIRWTGARPCLKVVNDIDPNPRSLASQPASQPTIPHGVSEHHGQPSTSKKTLCF